MNKNYDNTSAQLKGDDRVCIKALSAAVFVGLTILGAQGVGAEEVETPSITDGIDYSKRDLDTPMLDFLNSQGAIMPAEKDANGEVIDATEQVYPKSSYSIERVDTAGENTIQKYEYNPETHEVTEINYKVELTPEVTNLGTGDGVNYYKWGTLENSSHLYNVLETATQDDYAIKANYTTDNQLERIVNKNGPNYGDINGNFINIEKYDYNEGSAITVSDSELGNITANFVNNKGYYAQIASYGSKIGDITGDFIGNYGSGTGGAIYNTGGTIGKIKGDFIANHTMGTGGAINSQGGSIDSIVGNFIGNRGDSQAGAINLQGTQLGSIKGNFIGNSAIHGYGGAIYLAGTIGDITGDFIGNQSNGRGAAIYLSRGSIGDITGDFIGNYGNVTGAIEVCYGTSIGNITGDFIGNTATQSLGGAIIVNGSVGYINGNFMNNKAGQYGGAILNWGSIKGITGDFIGNKAGEWGGAIRDDRGIDFIKGNFINNGVETANYGYVYNFGDGYGGAIYLSGKGIGLLKGDFINNYILATGTESGDAAAHGGAIAYGRIDNIIGDFIGNSANAVSEAGYAMAYGGAFYSPSKMGDIEGDFVNNSAKAVSDTSDATAYGGAIAYGTFDDIKGDFINNSAIAVSGSDTAITTAQGGAIYNSGIIGAKDEEGNVVGGLINSSLVGNYAKAEKGTAYGGAILTKSSLNLYAQNGYTSTISGNYVEDVNGRRDEAIYVTAPIYESYKGSSVVQDEADKKSLYKESLSSARTLSMIANTDGTFVINDEIVSEDQKLLSEEMFYNINDNGVASKQYVKYDEESNSYIKIDNPDPTLLTEQNKLQLKGDSSGKIYLNNSVKNFDIEMSDISLYLGRDDVLNTNNNLTLNSGTLSMVNNQVGVSALDTLTVTGNTNMTVDVDLENEQMDRFTAENYGEHAGNINVVGMNLLSDAKNAETAIYFAQTGLKNNVTNGTSELPQTNVQTTAYTPIYKYNVTYNPEYATAENGLQDGGYFVFNRGDKIAGNPSNPSEAFNPAVLATPVAAQTGATATMNQTFNYAFQNADNFMNIPYLERVAIKNANKYALSPTGDATDVGTFSPLFTKTETSSVWVKPYASFESIPLKNGPKVSSNTYGTLFGYDTPLVPMKRGWDRTWTGYIGYNGASQHYSGVDSTQNGGLLGGTLTLYKGNFFNATTVSAGASVASNQTMYGHEDFTMLLAGIGNKTGYNFEFKEGKVILQPSMLMSYTFVNTFDYTNAAGVRIKSDPLHAIQLAPGVKLIGNTKNGWQPYLSVNMVWNLLDKSDVHANDVKLPEMSIKPFVQYGVGVQKRFKDNCMAFGQAMIQNGGRNGISLTAGFRWAIGKDRKDVEKVHNETLKQVQGDKVRHTLSKGDGRVQPTKTVIKQLTPAQRVALGAKPQNTTRTTNLGVLK